VTGEAALVDCRLLGPVLPGKVVAVGLNYRAHAEEFATAVHAEPILFMKPSTAVIGPGDGALPHKECTPKRFVASEERYS